LVIASGIAVLTPGRLGTERDAPDPEAAGRHRIASEAAALSLASRGVRSSVVRLAPSVHGERDHGFVPALIDIARTRGVSEHSGWLAGFFATDVPASSALTRELLGWQPTQPGLLDDLDEGHYFRAVLDLRGRVY
jgi:hypothetical protein